jgi:hypothetical protein
MSYPQYYAFLAVCTLAVAWVAKRLYLALYGERHYRHLPGPKSTNPLWGSLTELYTRRNPNEQYLRWTSKPRASSLQAF